MHRLRSRQRTVTIDGIEYEKRVDRSPRGGVPHKRTILTETKGTVFSSEIVMNEDRTESTVTRTALTLHNYKRATALLVAILVPEYRIKCTNYRYMLLRYDGKKMLPIPAIYNLKEDKIDNETRLQSAKSVMAFIAKLLDLDTPSTIYSDGGLEVRVDWDCLIVKSVARNGATVTRRCDKETGFRQSTLRTLEEAA